VSHWRPSIWFRVFSGLGLAAIPLAFAALIVGLYVLIEPGVVQQRSEKACADVGRCVEAGGDIERCHEQFPHCRQPEAT
jgi:hypothetical protein